MLNGIKKIVRGVILGAFMAGAALGAATDTNAEITVALVLPGSIADGGWNEGAYRGLKRVEALGGFKVAVSENVSQADIPRVVAGYADDGFDLIIGHGFQFGSLFAEISVEYPDQRFFATTSAPGNAKIPSNALYVDFRYPDAGYGAGVVAALMTANGKAVGAVGGGDNPTTQAIMATFKAAAEKTRAGLKGYDIITGDYNDAAKGREAAATMIGNGADVIWHTADITGIGAVEGASAKGARVIGMYTDQKDLAPEQMGTSFVANNSGLVEEIAKMVKAGTFEGGREWKPDVKFLWLTTYGDKPYNDKLISAEAWKTFEKVWTDISVGKIDTASLIK